MDTKPARHAPRPGLTETEIDAAVVAILDEATLEEKVAMMSGRGFISEFVASGGRWGDAPYRAGGGLERLGVPALYFTDGPRGVARGNSTCFPVSMARGASFDRDLERRIGEVIGIEARAQGCNLSGAVCINLLRHPAWGRAQETYGEDPYHVGEMGAALAEGIQTHNVIATVKHFALNSIENARFKVDVRVDERTLREVYLPHFQRVFNAGCASVMSAYNKVNGEYCGQNRRLLTNILRGEMGFAGFVHSDWLMGVYAPYGATAGLDIENPEPIHYGAKLIAAVEEGTIGREIVDEACRRILTVTYRFASAEDPIEHYTDELVACPGHIDVAREAAEKSAVLLKNDGTLPFRDDTRVAIFGRLADAENIGDEGSSRVQPPYVITPLAGLRRRLGDHLTLGGDEEDPEGAANAASRADACVVIVGHTRDEEGEFIPADMGIGKAKLPPHLMAEIEKAMKTARPSNNDAPPGDRGGDRLDLRLSTKQVCLIEAVCRANPRTVVVIVAGSAVLTDPWDGSAGAILQTFYGGMEGGTALASMLCGDVSPSGKLPFTVARSHDQYPFFDADADRIDYGYWHGYTLFDREDREAAYPFGHGLSYARFSYRALKARKSVGGISAEVSVRNESGPAADEIVQLYLGFPGAAVERPVKLLRGFERVRLQSGETRTVRFFVPDSDLRYWDTYSGAWRTEPGRHMVFAGGTSRTDHLLSAELRL